MDAQAKSQADPLDAVVESVLQSYRRGERPDISELASRHPDLAHRLREIAPALMMIEELGSVAGAVTVAPSPVAKDAVASGTLGDYRLLREIGRGGMGIVYQAVQESLGRYVALKVLPNSVAGRPLFLERFQREARAAARLHHTNIVAAYGVGEHEGTHYYAMQYIQGQGLDAVLEDVRRLRGVASDPSRAGTLSASIAQSLMSGHFRSATENIDFELAPLPQQPTTEGSSSGLSTQPERTYHYSVARLGLQAADGLAHAHAQGVLHRDVKPSNLMLDTHGVLWITDFGLAKLQDSDELTNTGDLVGTLRYMAPERFEGKGDSRSDIYSLGATLYEMLTLQPPFSGADRAGLIGQITQEPPAPPSRITPLLPRDLETIVTKAMARDPALRYQKASDLAEDLRRFLENRPIKARRSSVRERAWRWCRRNPAIAGLVAAVFLLLVCLTVGSLVAAVRLARERNEVVASRKEKEEAEQQKTEQLYRSLLDQARASRFSRRMGQRYDSLKALSEAAKIAHELGKPEESFLELRNEAIACFALQDLRVAREWDGWSEIAYSAKFDSNLARYARTDRGGRVAICSAADDGASVRSMVGSELAFSPNGQFIVLEDRERRWALWDLDSPAALPLVASETNENRFAFSPDNRRFAVSAGDGSITIYDLPSGKQLAKLGGTSARLCSIVFHPREPKIVSIDNTNVEIRDLETGNVLQSFSYPFEYYPCAAWHPDGKVLAVVGGDRSHPFLGRGCGKRNQQAGRVQERR